MLTITIYSIKIKINTVYVYTIAPREQVANHHQPELYHRVDSVSSSTGWNCTLTSAISFLALFSVLVILASNSEVSRTLSKPETSAVRSTNISEPERLPRRSRIPRSEEGVEARGTDDVGTEGWDAIRGSSSRVNFWRVAGLMPASVRSPKAPARRLNPCCNITTDTRRPVTIFSTLHITYDEE